MRKIYCIAALMLVTSALADYVDANNETYQPIECIVATGGQWIVTDIRPTCTDTVKMKFRLSSTAKTQALYCSRTTMTTNTFTAFFIDGVVRCDRNTNTSTKGNTRPSINGDTTFVADYATRRFSVNGIDQDVMMAEGGYTPGSDLMLFASHKKGNDLSPDIDAQDVDNRATYRLYYFELYSAGCEEPKHRLMPVRRKSDLVVGLYDSVVGKFYGPADNSDTFFAGSAIRNVTAKHRYPWGKVDITYEVVGDVSEGISDWFCPVLVVTATNRIAGACYIAAADFLSGDVGTEEGLHHVVWDLKAQGFHFKSDDVLFRVAYCEKIKPSYQYCVIDLSAGSNAASYPVTYLTVPPSGGFNVSEYKTTKLVLKRIEAGSFKMNGSYGVTLTKPFYCGLFEVTQRQWALVTGSDPCSSTSNGKGSSYPVHYVWYNMIRGSSAGAGWPSSSAVDSSSFLGKLRTRTGIDFDLPTEAQWEYACRAGTTTTYNYGNSVNGSFMWYRDNSTKSCEVGTKSPNSWGFYDMHGNVEEFCLDWYASGLTGGTDPKGSSSGSYRVLRGGGWLSYASSCTSSSRASDNPGDYYDQRVRYRSIGFRLVCTLSNQ